MDFVFDIDKAVAASAHLAKKNKGAISTFFLMKTLYAAERFALEQWHRPITGDSFVSMRKGPVLSRTYDLIKGAIPRSNSDMVKWSAHFGPREGNNVPLIQDVAAGFLSDREIEALERAAQEIRELVRSKGVIAETLHKRWPEWEDPGDGMKPIELKRVLEEVVKDEDDVESVLSEIQSINSAKAALQVRA